MKAMATRNVLTSMNAKMLLIRYGASVVSFGTIGSSYGELSNNLTEHLMRVKITIMLLVLIYSFTLKCFLTGPGCSRRNEPNPG